MEFKILMSIAIALQRVAPNYKYRGSLTAENEQAFNDLVTLSGIKPTWAEVSAEVQVVIAEIQAKETEDAEWEAYKKAEEEDKKQAWRDAGKPTKPPKA